jgi:hypothetical protein
MVKDLGILATKTPWLRRTKWAERFVDKDIENLNHLADIPLQQYEEERLVWSGVGITLNQCWS